MMRANTLQMDCNDVTAGSVCYCEDAVQKAAIIAF